MKKLLLLAVCCMMFCGCENKFQIGNDLKIKKKNNKYLIEGSFSNKKKDCGIYTITFKLQNGNIMKYYDSTFPVLVDNDVYEFSVDIEDNDLNAISNLDKYQIKIDNIKCFD